MAEISIINKKYTDLHTSPEVNIAVNRRIIRSDLTQKQGNQLKSNPEAKLTVYLERFHEIFNREEGENKDNGVRAIKKLAHKAFVIKEDEIPNSVYALEQTIARERGHGNIEITDDFIKAKNSEIITAQTQSIDQWIDYLSGSDAFYPDWFKYLAFRSITKMGEYNKSTAQFNSRNASTAKPFPELDSEALGLVQNAIESTLKNENGELITSPNVEKLAKQAKFDRLYPLALSHLDNIRRKNAENKENIEGSWIMYKQGSDAKDLENSLKGYGTGWCTATGAAPTQLEVGDFYVFYSKDRDEDDKVPRIAIRMENGNIAEIRGINPGQELEEELVETMEEKASTLNGYSKYQKATIDMKKMTEIERKNKLGEELDAQDLIFLYEIDSNIEGFGYDRDPRIGEIKSNRFEKNDASIMGKFKYPEAKSDEIVSSVEDFNPNSKYLIWLTDDSRTELITSPLCTSEILNSLVDLYLNQEIKGNQIINDILQNNNLSTESIIKIYNSIGILGNLLKHPNLPLNIFQEVLNNEISNDFSKDLSDLVENVNIPLSIISLLIKDSNNGNIILKLVEKAQKQRIDIDLKLLYDRLSKNPRLFSEGFFEDDGSFVEDFNNNRDNIKLKIAALEPIDPEILMRVFEEDNDKQVRLCVLGNSNCPADILNIYKGSNNLSVIDKLTNNPTLDAKYLEELITRIQNSKINFDLEEFPISNSLYERYFENNEYEESDGVNSYIDRITNVLILKVLMLKIVCHPNFSNYEVGQEIINSLIFKSDSTMDDDLIESIISYEEVDFSDFLTNVYNKIKEVDLETTNKAIEEIKRDLKNRRNQDRGKLSHPKSLGFWTIKRLINSLKKNTNTPLEILAEFEQS